MKKLCSLLLALIMLLSLVTVSASASGSDVVLPKSEFNPDLTVTLTNVLSVKSVKVLDQYYDNQYNVAYKEDIITVYQLPLEGAEVKFSGKLNYDLFPGGYGGFDVIDGRYQRTEVDNYGQWWYIGTVGVSQKITGTAGDTSIQILHICEGLDICFTFVDLSAYAVQPENPFTDISKTASYYDAVIWANKTGVTGGYADNTFRPTATCTRGQVVTFLWRSLGCPEPSSTENPFTDVKSSAYYYKAVLWAVEKGITGGYSDNTFRPDTTCTSGHVITFLWRSQGKPAATCFSELRAIRSSLVA